MTLNPTLTATLPVWTDISFSKRDQPYILVDPTRAQRRRKIKGRMCGFSGHVARFITSVAERAAHAVHRAEETRRFIMHQLFSFGSNEGEIDEGRLRNKPLKARERAAHQAKAFHGPRTLLRGEMT